MEVQSEHLLSCHVDDYRKWVELDCYLGDESGEQHRPWSNKKNEYEVVYEWIIEEGVWAEQTAKEERRFKRKESQGEQNNFPFSWEVLNWEHAKLILIVEASLEIEKRGGGQ